MQIFRHFRSLALAGLGPLIFAPLPGLGEEVGKSADSWKELNDQLPEFRWHLTARPWEAQAMPEKDLLGQMEKALSAMVPWQYWNQENAEDAKNGAIIDPYDKKEIQYGTPLFAFNVAVLLTRGHGKELITPALRAMDRSTLDISDGPANDWHGEFFCAAMVKALRIFEEHQAEFPEITDERVAMWKNRMKANRNHFMNMKVKQNWRTFAMKGEWLRHQDGYITDGVKWNEASWIEPSEGSQRERFHRDRVKYKMDPYFYFYHDDTADPEPFVYNGATTANLLDMLENGYDGESADEIREAVTRNIQASLFILGGSGECAAGGRTGEHIWGDSVYANAFELLAEASFREGDENMAGQYRHAAELLLRSHSRFRQENGWFSITKNVFHPSLKHRYASWSGVANYENFTLTCCAETLLARKNDIPARPIPSEIGGYVMTLDPGYGNIFLNAGGMQAQLVTRGETDNYGDVQWHTLGITRFSRTGWDGRMGPGAAHVNSDFSDGFSFSPIYKEDGKWQRVCLQPKRFEGSFETHFIHPLLVRGTFTIAPVEGQSGPSFAMHMTLTPDGALIDTEAGSEETEFGVLWPLMDFDGQTVLESKIGDRIASTAYPAASGDEIVLPVGKKNRSKRLLEWEGVNGGDGGASSIGFSYAADIAGGGSKQVRLMVNGVEQPALTFISTIGKHYHDATPGIATPDPNFSKANSPHAWHSLYVPVTLNPGAENTIRIEIVDEVTIDELRVRPAIKDAPISDQQNFIALGKSPKLDASSPAVRGGYGDFLPIQVTENGGGSIETFVYPRSEGDPSAEEVQSSFQREGKNFSSILGRVEGDLYVGRSSAGGVGSAIDLDADGKDDVVFEQSCAFILQLKDGQITAIEADRPVVATIGGKEVALQAFEPVQLSKD